MEDRRVLAADFELLKDIVTAPSNASSVPEELTVVGDVTYFVAQTSTLGPQLWKTDGTEAGTLLVKEIRNGGYSAKPHSLTNVQGTLYFVAYDDVHGEELWKSDGTAAGTVLVKDVVPGRDGSTIRGLTVVGDDLFFTAGVDRDIELWKSDGTAEGTTLVKDIRINYGSHPRYLTNVNGTLFFAASGGGTGYGLWKSDGTAAGTVMVKDVYFGPSSSGNVVNVQLYARPRSFLNVGDTLYFSAAATAGFNYELWKSDGTSEGTVLVKEIRPGTGSEGSNPQHFSQIDNMLLFAANDGAHGFELWKSDGTAAGTTLLKDTRAGVSGGLGSDLAGNWIPSAWFTPVVDELFFVANDGFGRELWKTDGTASGTVRATDVFASDKEPVALTNVGGTLHFGGDGSLWKSDGSGNGATPVRDFGQFGLEQFPEAANLAGTLLFVAGDPEKGFELWKSDGTTVGTARVKDIASGGGSSWPGRAVEFGNALYFIADNRLWRTDGSPGNAVNVTPALEPGAYFYSTSLTVAGNALYFATANPEHTGSLWMLTYGAVGAVRMKELEPGAYFQDDSLTNADGALYFITEGITGWQAWRSDGTSEGTVAVPSPNPLPNLMFQKKLLVVGGTVFFNSYDDDLWKIGEGGSVRIKQFYSQPYPSYARDLTEVGGTLYFSSYSTDPSLEWTRTLWKSDGTTAGTVAFQQLPESFSRFPLRLANYGGMLYFTALDDQQRGVLWKSDGTAAGTLPVKVISNEPNGISPDRFAQSGGLLYFTADGGATGKELWRTDGTAAGTFLLKDILPGAASSAPRNLTDVYGTLYFSAYDEIHGEELWKSDGTVAGTVLVKDFVPDSGSSAPTHITPFAGGVVVAVTTPEYGQEVWTMMPESEGDYTGDGATDGADFLAWQRGFGAVASPAGSGADGDGNGSVGSGDLAVWKTGFGAGGDAPLTAGAAAVVTSELSVASLIASEEISTLAVDESFGGAVFNSADDAAFAWLAAYRTAIDRGGWNRSAATGELRFFDQPAQPARSASPTTSHQSTADQAQLVDDAGELHGNLDAKLRRRGKGQAVVADEADELEAWLAAFDRAFA